MSYNQTKAVNLLQTFAAKTSIMKCVFINTQLQHIPHPQDVHAEHTLEEQTPSADEDQANDWQIGDIVIIRIQDDLRSGKITSIKDDKAYIRGKRMNRWFLLSRISQHLQPNICGGGKG